MKFLGFVSGGSKSIRCCICLIVPKCPFHIYLKSDIIAGMSGLRTSNDRDILKSVFQFNFRLLESYFPTVSCCLICVKRILGGL